MKQKLSFKEYIYVASMLFGMFFGAGNLIFPVYMGQVAGRNMWAAVLGFLITGVGLPLLGVAALGISRSNGLFDLSHKVGRPYAFFFTCALYLTIGPFFAIPRCATTSFTVGLEQILPHDDKSWLYLLLFSLLFFAVTLVLSLRPGKILTYVGKVLTPCFLVFLAIMVFVTILHPTTSIGAVLEKLAAEADSRGAEFVNLFYGSDVSEEDAQKAGEQLIQGLGVEKAESVAMTTVRSGILSCLLMGVIYLLVTLMGVWSRGALEAAPNGGTALAQIAQHYLGKAGLLVLAATVTLACLKTAVGLITSCAETFVGMFPKGLSYRNWVFVFTGISFLLANVGLTAIITYAVPVLMFLYPLAITLILLALLGHFFDHDRAVYAWVTGLTLVAAFYDLLRTLPDHLRAVLHVNGLVDTVGKALPFATIGLGWICPAILGLVIGLIFRAVRPKKA
jgi:LIVCS family branched-chain amino acid:cation transporter